MKVNLTKTWELLLKGRTTRTPPEPLEIIGRKEKLKLLGVTFKQVPVNWDTHIDYLLSKASSRLYIIRICKYYGYNIVFTFYSKYLSGIDKLFARCYKLGYCLRQHSILDIRRNRDMKLWQRISSTNTALSDLLPPQRTRQMRTTISVTFVGTLSPFFPSFPFNVDLQDARVQNNNYATQHWGREGLHCGER